MGAVGGLVGLGVVVLGRNIWHREVNYVRTKTQIKALESDSSYFLSAA